MCELAFDELLALRLSNSSFNQAILQNESHLVRHILKRDTPSLVLNLWPPPEPPQPTTISYLSALNHRDAVAWKMATHIADFIMIKICRRTTGPQQAAFAFPFRRIRSRTQPLILTLYHFFECCRREILLTPVTKQEPRLLESLAPDGSLAPDSGTPYRQCYFAFMQATIIGSYDPKQLLQVHQMYQLILAAFVRKLRPPSYAGRFERTLRGWSKAPATQTDIAKVLLLGGLGEVERIIKHKTYAARRTALDEFIEGLPPSKKIRLGTNAVVAEAPTQEEVLYADLIPFPDLGHIWNTAADYVLLAEGVIRRVSDIGGMRVFVEALMKDDDDDGLRDDGWQDDMDRASSDEEDPLGEDG